MTKLDLDLEDFPRFKVPRTSEERLAEKHDIYLPPGKEVEDIGFSSYQTVAIKYPSPSESRQTLLDLNLEATLKIASESGFGPPRFEGLELSEKYGLSGFVLFEYIDAGPEDALSFLDALSFPLANFNLSIYHENDGGFLVIEFDTRNHK